MWSLAEMQYKYQRKMLQITQHGVMNNRKLIATAQDSSNGMFLYWLFLIDFQSVSSKFNRKSGLPRKRQNLDSDQVREQISLASLASRRAERTQKTTDTFGVGRTS